MKWTIAGAGALLAAVPAGAQVAPPAQALQRNPTINPDRINEEQRRRAEARANPELVAPTRPEVEAPPPAAPTAGTAGEVRFVLTGVDFDRSDYLSRTELDALVQPLIGREIAFAELQSVVDRINQLYAARNLTTARAVLPAQQVEGGRVQIRLVEGRIGATTVEGGSARSRRYAQGRGSLEAGTLASPTALEEQLRLFNLNNDAQLRARLQPGADFGRTDVALTVQEPPRFGADLFVDNNGFASTGEAEVGVVLRGYRLLGDADRVSLVGVASRGVRSGNLSLSTPIGDRIRVGASGSYGRTRVIFGPVAELDVRGTSYSFGGDIAALLAIDDRMTVTGTGAVTTSFSRTDIAGQRVIDNEAINAVAGLITSYAVPGFAATLQYNLTLANVDEKLSGTTVTPLLLQGGATFAKALNPQVQARARFEGQLSTTDLLPGIVQYQIGGARASRAFAPGVAAGDHGFSASLELAYGATWDGLAIEPMLFVDHAEVATVGYKARAGSVGAGLTLTYSPRIIVRGTVATAFERAGGLAQSTRAFVSTTFRL